MSVRGLAIAWLLLTAATWADACSCVLQRGPVEQRIEQSLREADAVFIARLLRSTLKPDRQESRMVREDAQFEVLKVFKGSVRKGQVIRVYQVVSGSSCGMSGEPYGLSQCTRSSPLNAGGAEDAKVLGKIARTASPKL